MPEIGSPAGPASPADRHADMLGSASANLSRAGPKRQHYPALDGLRGLAILMVMACHYVQYTPALNGPDGVATNVFINGTFGVDLFFVLSGFLITGILYDSKEIAHRFRNFYARRFLRIFPLYFGVLAVAFGVLLVLRVAGSRAFYGGSPAATLWAAQPWLWTYTANIWMAVTHTAPWYFGHFWTLCVEEQFYLAWPVVVFFLPRRGIVVTCLLLIAGALVLRLAMSAGGAGAWIVNFLTPCRVDPLAAGALVAMLLRSPDQNLIPRLTRWARQLAPVLAVGAVILLVVFPIGQYATAGAHPAVSRFLWRASRGRWCRDLQFTAMALLFSATVLLLVSPQGPAWLKRAFSWMPLRVIGGYSYGIYVFHFPILGLMLLLEARGRFLHRLATGGLAGAAAFVALNVLLSFGIAFASFHLYEKRFLKLKKHFPETAPRAAPAAK